MRGNLTKLVFWKKFTRYLTVGISTIIVLAYFQSTPTSLKAEDEGNNSCQGTVVARNVGATGSNAGGSNAGDCRTFDLGVTCQLPAGWLIGQGCPQGSPLFTGTVDPSSGGSGGSCSQQTNQTNRCQNSQRCYYTTTYNTNGICGNTTETLINCQSDSNCGSQSGFCSASTDTNRRCYNGQRCRFDITTNADNVCGRVRENGPYSCRDDSSCGSSENQCRSISCSTPPAGCFYVNQWLSTCDPNVSLTCGDLNFGCNQTVSTSSTSTITRSSDGGGVDVIQHNTQTQTNNQNVTIKFD